MLWRKPYGRKLWAASRSCECPLTDSQQENWISVLQVEGTEFCQQSHKLGKGPELQVRTQLGSHLDFSLVRPWVDNPAMSCPDFWPTESAKLMIVCCKTAEIKRKKKECVLPLFSFPCPSLLVTVIPTCPNCNFLETKCVKPYQRLTSPLGPFAFLHSDRSEYKCHLFREPFLPHLTSDCLSAPHPPLHSTVWCWGWNHISFAGGFLLRSTIGCIRLQGALEAEGRKQLVLLPVCFLSLSGSPWQQQLVLASIFFFLRHSQNQQLKIEF